MGHGLVEREDLQASFLHGYLTAVDLIVAFNYFEREVAPAMDQREDCLVDRLLHDRADSQDGFVHLFECAEKVQ
jgi:hypothetical protein